MKRTALAALLSTAVLISVADAQTASVQHVSSNALEAAHVVEASPDHVLSAFGCTGITGGTTGFCIAYNAAAAPAGGALTAADVIDVCQFSSAVGCSFSRIPLGSQYPAGIVILLSSAVTPFTYTTGTETGFLWADYN